MKRVLVGAATLLMLLASRAPAQAYIVSCNDVAALIQSSVDSDQSLAVGYIFGNIDFLAGLLCFVGNPQCACVQSVALDRPSDVGQHVGQHLVECINFDGTQPAFGSVARATKDLCPY